ncbi:hypothetical protein [Variovorax sp. HW608]|uniref:hypothetical protein n=1 Tax=Variovorax sp. HW608 TaxID=1034889 RepID=UPI0012FDE241|nr:hypothetical protein [Variovorax sp. HW608]
MTIKTTRERLDASGFTLDRPLPATMLRAGLCRMQIFSSGRRIAAEHSAPDAV